MSRPRPEHRFHAKVEEDGAYIDVYTDQTLASIASNRSRYWSTDDEIAAGEILAYRLDWPRR